MRACSRSARTACTAGGAGGNWMAMPASYFAIMAATFGGRGGSLQQRRDVGGRGSGGGVKEMPVGSDGGAGICGRSMHLPPVLGRSGMRASYAMKTPLETYALAD